MEEYNKMTDNSIYQSALSGRYADKAMQKIFSNDFKFQTWRKCWIDLAEAEKELGLTQITDNMIKEMYDAVTNIDYDVAKKREKETRHDVMSHVYEYGLHCPEAKGIIHLGATSQYVCCNTDLIQQKEALTLVKKDLVNTIYNLSKFAKDHKNLATLGFTHYQPGQPTTVGKRNTLYIQDLLMDLEQIEHLESIFKARGAKGTVGTQASYLTLFDGNHGKVKKLDELVTKKLGFSESYPVTGQTYSRKFDTMVSSVLAGIASSASKFACDLRLLSNLKMQEEPFSKKQTGSSAMAYKRNPMRSERMTSLSRMLMNYPNMIGQIHANQWFERTLDDSSARRSLISEEFLLTNAVLKIYQNITKGMVVYPAQIKKHLDQELPFMATEEILMDLAKEGHNRNEMHEIIKVHSVAAGKIVKEEGKPNDLFERLEKDSNFPAGKEYLDTLLDNPSRFTGRASEQVDEFIETEVDPVLMKYKDLIGDSDSELNV